MYSLLPPFTTYFPFAFKPNKTKKALVEYYKAMLANVDKLYIDIEMPDFPMDEDIFVQSPLLPFGEELQMFFLTENSLGR